MCGVVYGVIVIDVTNIVVAVDVYTIVIGVVDVNVFDVVVGVVVIVVVCVMCVAVVVENCDDCDMCLIVLSIVLFVSNNVIDEYDVTDVVAYVDVVAAQTMCVDHVVVVADIINVTNYPDSTYVDVLYDVCVVCVDVVLLLLLAVMMIV